MFVRFQREFSGISALSMLKETLSWTGCSRCGNSQNRMLCNTKILKSPLRQQTRSGGETFNQSKWSIYKVPHDQSIRYLIKGEDLQVIVSEVCKMPSNKEEFEILPRTRLLSCCFDQLLNRY